MATTISSCDLYLGVGIVYVKIKVSVSPEAGSVSTGITGVDLFVHSVVGVNGPRNISSVSARKKERLLHHGIPLPRAVVVKASHDGLCKSVLSVESQLNLAAFVTGTARTGTYDGKSKANEFYEK